MSGRCVHHLVEAQVSETPHAVAAVWDGGTLTYRDLDERAGHLAGLLAARGVRPERLVGVAMEPSPLLLITLLAVWKAGGVYVPIDPALPSGVAETMLADAGVALLVRNGPACVDPAGLPVVDLDLLDLSGQTVARPAVTVAPPNLAYCVFTSGSTGKPKPVAVSHAALTNHALSLRDELRLVPEDRVLQFTAIAIDAALEEVLPAWLAGAAVVMPGQRRFSSWELTDIIDRLAVTTVSLPSAYWHHWVDDLTAGLVCLPASLRIVFVGGDKILVDKLAAWSRVPGAEAIDWVSDYGPTETTISVALHRPNGIRGTASSGVRDHALVPIGRPFANAEIYILDGDLRPVPDDTPGDIWVGGPPLARGYHTSPAATADRFLPDPQGPPGARMYRTGDRGSRSPDGTLVFLGRSDRQIKIRGHRVEPGQVESALHQCAGVKDAVVVTADDPPFGFRLVAYLEVEEGVVETTIRADVAGRLPEAMVPRTIVLLDQIPRSPLNGKVARSLLPPVKPASAGHTGEDTMTTLERVIATLAGDVLDGRPIRRAGDFFAAGGDSLRALQLLSRVSEVTGVALTFAQFRSSPHVAGLAALVRQEHSRGAPEGAVVPTGDRGGRRPASRGQQALWFLNLLHRGAPTYAIPLCYKIRGPLDLDRLDAALSAIVARHEALRTVLEEQDGRVWQQVRPPSPVRTAMTVVADASEASRRAMEEAARPFDLTTGPMLRSACFRVDAGEHLWLLNVHHSAFDAWSLAIFWRELAALYDGRPLPEVTIQYTDYSAWQERWLRSAEADEQRAYWRDRLAGDPPTVTPGSGRGAGGGVGTKGFALQLPPDAVNPITVERVAESHGTTTFTVLLAAFIATLRRTSRVDEAVVGVVMASRNRPGAEDLIGYLANTVALRMRFTEGMRFHELISRTGEALAEALTNQELPFSDVVDGLERSGGTGQNPLFQVTFSLQSTPLDDHGTIEGLDITEQFVHQGTARVALSLMMRQSEAGLSGEVVFAADRFDRSSARRWQNALLTLLSAGLADPDALIDELPLPVAENATELTTAVDAGSEGRLSPT
ncbi:MULTISPECIES: non-ribosomal peptide synthetase [Actinomadura]|uniref:Non-ribosomal peptide synthetase n=1 Tax=Actinomadura yumaensis TaxID=111807 RepID=A0ABW2CLH0_9ACTN|nr:non-ribosomal peptide synthetase [Actinomadura sp. J1-007]MWK37147.1 amino acid adenylation domain-containing protein [Actinomadura sp. J1-007]